MTNLRQVLALNMRKRRPYRPHDALLWTSPIGKNLSNTLLIIISYPEPHDGLFRRTGI